MHCGTAVGARRQLVLRILFHDNVHASGIGAKEDQLHCRGAVRVPNPKSVDLCGGDRPGGVLYVRQQRQIPLAWEGWVAQPVDRSQACTGRVPSSGHLGGTALPC